MDPFENALTFLESIKNDLTDADQPYLERLKTPKNIVSGELEVTMDDGRVEKLQAYRSQHNNALGPYKGGIRFHEGVTEAEVKALSLWMSIKTSIAGLPMGGGNGGVIVDPKKLSGGELERISRAYMQLIAKHIGVDVDVPAPDVNTDPQMMAWMLDEYEKIVGHQEPGVITGKPIELGGSAGRTKATGYGGFLALQHLKDSLKDMYPDNAEGWYNGPREKVRIAIQGFGNVGYYFAISAYEHGYTVVAVSDSKGAVYDERGLDPVAVMAVKEEKGSVTDFPGKVLTNEELLALDVEVLVPSALESVITVDNMASVKAPVILELANGPITPEADEHLLGRDVIVVPDVYANSGGVTVSYLEWVQNRMGYYWKEQEVDDKLEELMGTAFKAIWGKYVALREKDGPQKVTLRRAVYILAVERIIQAERLRSNLRG